LTVKNISQVYHQLGFKIREFPLLSNKDAATAAIYSSLYRLWEKWQAEVMGVGRKPQNETKYAVSLMTLINTWHFTV
jgi:hypothetical protein